MTTTPFFIHVVHSLLGAMRHAEAPKLPSKKVRAPRHMTCGSTGASLSESRAWIHGTCDSVKAHLNKDVRSGAEGLVTAPELTSVIRQGPRPQDTWRRQSSPLQWGVVRSYSLHDIAWMHTLLFILTWSLYTRVPDIQGTDTIKIHLPWSALSLQSLSHCLCIKE
jgi:hypothetical protein